MPLQRRLPKRGFVSLSKDDTAEVRLRDLAKLPVDEVDLLALKAAGLVPPAAKTAKVIKTGTLDKAVKLSGVAATKGAKAAIEAAGGSVAEPAAETQPEAEACQRAKRYKSKTGKKVR